ncbi:clathrin adaptor mu subunit [Rhodofomes roseus]|uniref:Clathrin adaptor mu subunit n=1 Tax=Rhodofomes roseus TaxID=34475 RepID=A0ABQ8KXD8_9APHY|nr:clathrin adaptor mu subunit [Rhodofomes roseus]KAH9843729.1 clathrin adaptor mu subunit [Rhodofomes roseus]
MAIDGIVMLDSTGRPIIQSGFRSTSSTYPLLHIDAVNDALSNAPKPEDVDPVIYVSGFNIDIPCACCHAKVGDMRILCPISGEVDPLYAFAFMETFVDILREYFGYISAETLKENFDIVYQLLEETLDAGGHPLTTSPNALRDIVLPPSLLNKVLSVAGVPGLATPLVGPQPFASPIPWRKAGVRYNNNEIYFDVVETLEAIVNKNGTPASSNVWGRVESNCKLSGIPDLLLTLSNSQSLTDCSFHPCVRHVFLIRYSARVADIHNFCRLSRWARDKTLSFIPPDGRFKLLEYRYAPTSASTMHQVAVPLSMRTNVMIEEHGGTLDLSFTSRLTTRTMESVVIELYLGEGASGASCTASHNASWSFDPRTLASHFTSSLRWELKNVAPSATHTLRGTFASTVKTPRPARSFRVRFDIMQHSFSALKIDQLKLTGELYKPYKGMRPRSSGDIEWRW